MRLAECGTKAKRLMDLHETECKQACHRQHLLPLQAGPEILRKWKKEDGNIEDHVRTREGKKCVLCLFYVSVAESIAFGRWKQVSSPESRDRETGEPGHEHESAAP
jgi:hypothetical protein